MRPGLPTVFASLKHRKGVVEIGKKVCDLGGV